MPSGAQPAPRSYLALSQYPQTGLPNPTPALSLTRSIWLPSTSPSSLLPPPLPPNSHEAERRGWSSQGGESRLLRETSRKSKQSKIKKQKYSPVKGGRGWVQMELKPTVPQASHMLNPSSFGLLAQAHQPMIPRSTARATRDWVSLEEGLGSGIRVPGSQSLLYL